MRFVDGLADEREAYEALRSELEKQRERIERVEAEIEALSDGQVGKKKVLEALLKRMKEGEWRIRDALERRALDSERRAPFLERRAQSAERR